MKQENGWIGKLIVSRDGTIKGKILSCTSRYCAACSYVHPCFYVEWEDGRRTKPCTKGIRVNEDETLQIV